MESVLMCHVTVLIITFSFLCSCNGIPVTKTDMTAKSYPLLASVFATVQQQVKPPAQTVSKDAAQLLNDLQKPAQGMLQGKQKIVGPGKKPVQDESTIITVVASLICKICQQKNDLACMAIHCQNDGTFAAVKPAKTALQSGKVGIQTASLAANNARQPQGNAAKTMRTDSGLSQLQQDLQRPYGKVQNLFGPGQGTLQPGQGPLGTGQISLGLGQELLRPVQGTLGSGQESLGLPKQPEISPNVIRFSASILCQLCQQSNDQACITTHCWNDGTSAAVNQGETVAQAGNVGIQTSPQVSIPKSTGSDLVQAIGSGSMQFGLALPPALAVRDTGGFSGALAVQDQVTGIATNVQKVGKSALPKTFGNFMKMDKYKGQKMKKADTSALPKTFGSFMKMDKYKGQTMKKADTSALPKTFGNFMKMDKYKGQEMKKADTSALPKTFGNFMKMDKYKGQEMKKADTSALPKTFGNFMKMDKYKGQEMKKADTSALPKSFGDFMKMDKYKGQKLQKADTAAIPVAKSKTVSLQKTKHDTSALPKTFSKFMSMDKYRGQTTADAVSSDLRAPVVRDPTGISATVDPALLAESSKNVVNLEEMLKQFMASKHALPGLGFNIMQEPSGRVDVSSNTNFDVSNVVGIDAVDNNKPAIAGNLNRKASSRGAEVVMQGLGNDRPAINVVGGPGVTVHGTEHVHQVHQVASAGEPEVFARERQRQMQVPSTTFPTTQLVTMRPQRTAKLRIVSRQFQPPRTP